MVVASKTLQEILVRASYSHRDTTTQAFQAPPYGATEKILLCSETRVNMSRTPRAHLITASATRGT